MAAADAVFHQADTNRDQRLDLNEFRNLVGHGGVGGAGGAGGAYGAYGSSSYSSGGDLSGLGAAGGYGSSSYQSYESSSAGGLGGLGGGLAGGELAYAGGIGGAGGYGSSSYEQSSYSSGVGGGIGGADLGVVGIGGGAAYGVSGESSEYVSSAQSASVQQYATDAQGLYKDANPQIIRRPAPQGVQTYTQNIKIRFLQPPAVPPHGPLIIKEVRPPQPPAPPPLVVRQRAPPLPTPPPLVLRERPPPQPQTIASQTVIRRLAALPVPPRSVIIERLPAAPPRPRDIIIERWVPYGAQAKRKTIVQRAAAAQQYARPRNVIIQYEAPQVRIVRQFQRLGVTPANPQAYLQQYGASLFESHVLVQQARAAGVVEDISPPAVAGGYAASSEFVSGGIAGGELGLVGGGLVAGGLSGGEGYSSYSSEQYSAGGLGGLEAGGAYLGAGGVGGASSYEASSYSSSGDVSGLIGGAGLAGGLGGGSYESSSYSSQIGGLQGGNLGADAAFVAADTNRDGVLSQSEFRQAGF